jgi:hypothetical protein
MGDQIRRIPRKNCGISINNPAPDLDLGLDHVGLLDMLTSPQLAGSDAWWRAGSKSFASFS